MSGERRRGTPSAVANPLAAAAAPASSGAATAPAPPAGSDAASAAGGATAPKPDRDAADVRVARILFLAGCCLLPWLWILMMCHFSARWRAADCPPQLRLYLRRAAAGTAIVTVLFATWIAVFQTQWRVRAGAALALALRVVLRSLPRARTLTRPSPPRRLAAAAAAAAARRIGAISAWRCSSTCRMRSGGRRIDRPAAGVASFASHFPLLSASSQRLSPTSSRSPPLPVTLPRILQDRSIIVECAATRA